MVIIAKDFNDEMQDYLDKIYGKKERFVDTVKKPKKSVVTESVPEFSEEVYVDYETRPGFTSWVSNIFKRRPREDFEDFPPEKIEKIEQVEDELEMVDEEIDELEEQRESLLSRFFRLIRGHRRNEPVEEFIEEEDFPAIDEDVVDVLKRVNHWLEKLPNRDLRDFKTSEDFDKYKELLAKYGLIKK